MKIPFKINFTIITGILLVVAFTGINIISNVFTKPDRVVYIRVDNVQTGEHQVINDGHAIGSKKDVEDIIRVIEESEKTKAPEIVEEDDFALIEYGMPNRDKDYEAFNVWYDGKNVFLGVHVVHDAIDKGIFEYRIINEDDSKKLIACIEKYKNKI